MSNIHIAGGVLHVGFSLDGEKDCFEFLFCSSTSGSSGASLVWLCCLWMMRWCSICRCHTRWCQWTLVVVQFATRTGYQSFSAVRLCVPHAWHSLPLCWPASSEAEVAFLVSNLRCSFVLSPCFHITSVVRSIHWLFHQIPHFPFLTPHHRGATLASTFVVLCLVSTPDLCLDRIIASSYLYSHVKAGWVDVVTSFILHWLLPIR